MKTSSLLLIVFCLFSLCCVSVGGCGGHRETPPVPWNTVDACSRDTNRPNYCGDVQLRRFAAPVITYRIVGPGEATDIRLQSIPAQNPTGEQMNSIRGGFLKWQAAIGESRQIVEVPATDSAANISVMVQQPQFFSESFATEQLGRTDSWFSDVAGGIYGRAVIRLRSDLPERTFRYVALHETGHAIGLDGHSRKLGDVMYPISFPVVPLVELSERDKATIRADYEGR